MAPFRLKVIRGMFGVGEHVAPALAGRAAFELFCRTPNVKRLTPGEQRAVAKATDFMAEARHHRLKTKAGCIAVHEFRPQPGRARGGKVLVLHGWRSRTEYMRALIEGYRDAGFKVFSLDLPGHGQSAGRRLTMVSAVEAASQAAQWFGPFEVVIGHSFGGAVAVNAAVGSIAGLPRLITKRLVLVAAPSSLPLVFDGFSQMLNVGPRSQTAMAGRVESIAGRPLSYFMGDRMLAATHLPTLVIHAPDDREVAAEQARLYAAAGPHVELYWANGLGHRRILSDPAVVARAVAFAEPLEKALLH